MAHKKVKIAAIGDIHVNESDKGKWVECFQAVSEQADVLQLCGDLTDTGKEEEAHVLAEELTACTIPVVAVMGNHDYEKGNQACSTTRSCRNRKNTHSIGGGARAETRLQTDLSSPPDSSIEQQGHRLSSWGYQIEN